MVCGKLSQVVRYKTMWYFVVVVISVTLVTNLFIIFPTAFSMHDEHDSMRSSFINARLPRVDSRRIGQDSRDVAWDSRTSFSPPEKPVDTTQDGLITTERTARMPDPSLSTGGRNIHSDPTISQECQNLYRHHMSPPYRLSAVLLVRVYRHDRAGLSSREMLQWLFYLRYAGFDHVFVYDAYVGKKESQYHVLLPLVQSGYITYVDWSAYNPYTIKGTQISAYQDCVDNYGSNLTWHMAIDIDEYPFSPIDVEPNFMQRFLHNFSVENPHVSQITLQNYLFLGKPLDSQDNPFLIARLRRRTHKKGNDLGKSVFRVAQMRTAEVHHNEMRDGKTIDSDAQVMRLNHYWGARLQDWGEDTPRILKLTETDYSVKPIVDRLNRCSKYFGTGSLYMKRWN
ncbi:Hypothetical predicted protein [Paramuricea clavata]|uniref:Glycosyltransferase family 92 protein n=1 Tax=Paramuricea clavata TaxID=317549 RepID=A0A6S7HUX4_PARCT|nr:Hypothetical predicted protein [Paramuricea clavata]